MKIPAQFLLMLATASLLSAAPVQAAEKELLDVLLANGAITETQYQDLLDKPKLTRSDVDDVVVKLDRKGLNVTSSDGDFAFKLGSRLHFQASSHSGDLPPGVDATDGTEFRRSRIEMKGKFHRDWAWAAEADFADNKVSLKDFWLGYNAIPNTKLYLGHQKQPYSLSVEMSSNDIPFIERSVDNELIIPFTDRALGLRVERTGERWFAAAGVFGEAVDANKDDDEGFGASARFVYAPIMEDNRTLHLGVRAAMRTPSASTESFRIRDETTHQSNLRIVDTGEIGSIDRATMYGVEAAFVQDAWSVVGEYNMLNLARDGASDLDFDSWHVYGTWSITGESRAEAYKIGAGEFKRINPANPFDWREGTWGAWELAMRYAHIDLNDGALTGGDETVLTSAINWYLNSNVRLMFELSHILETDGSSLLRDEAEGLNIFQFRSQYTF